MEKRLLQLCIIISICGCTNNKQFGKSDPVGTLDSLGVYIKSSADKTLPNDVRAANAIKAFDALKKSENTPQARADLTLVASKLYVLKQRKSLTTAIRLNTERSIAANDSTNLAQVYNLRGNLYIDDNQNDSAFYYFLKAEKLFSKTKDSIALGKNYLDKAFVQLYESDYSGCELTSIQSLNFLKNSDEWQKQYDAYNLIGISSNELKNYDNALTYHEKALNFVNKYPSISASKLHFRSSSYNNIGYVYQNLNKDKEAVANFRNGLAEKNLYQDNPYIYSTLLDNVAYSQFKQKDYSNLPKLFLDALNIKEANHLNSGIVAIKLHLSEYYAAISDTLRSQQMAHEALAVAKSSDIAGDLLAVLKQLSVVEHKNASVYSRQYIEISDSIQTEERKAKDKFARIAYETDEIIGEKDKLAEQNRSLVYFFVGTLLIGLLLFVIRAQRARNRELLMTQAQQKANEDIYNLMISQQATIEESRVREKKRIAQELHDGVLGRLFGARLNLDSLNRASDDDSIASRFNYLSELKNIEQDIREISHDLNREKFVLINNFVAIVNNLLEEQGNSYATKVISYLDEKIQWDLVSNAIKINLYRILQESLQNINKYAKAESVTIDFKKVGDAIILRISDNGIGFETNTKKKGIGLQNMHSRVNECNGSLNVSSTKGNGTIITVTVPIVFQNVNSAP